MGLVQGTKVGPIVKIGTWTLALEISRFEDGRAARAAAYAIASKLCDTFPDYDVRVEYNPRLAVTVEVCEDADFPIAIRALVAFAGER